MNFVDVVRDMTSNAHHKYDSVNKIKIKIMDAAKQDQHEYYCDYNGIDKEVIKLLREEGFDISLVSEWKRMKYIIKW